MVFLSPGWLLGLTALLVPLAIHLWSRRRATVIRVGSLRFLEGLPPVARRAVVLEDIGLLLLRLALLAAVVLALAGAALSTPRAPVARPHLVLVSPGAVGDTAVRAGIDSLVAVGASSQPIEGDWWSAIAEAADTLPAGSRITVVAPLLAKHFLGLRPRVPAEVVWWPVQAQADTAVESNPRAATLWIEADSAHLVDAHYLTAALASVAELRGDSLGSTEIGTPPGAGDWIFWLRDDDVPAAVDSAAREGATLFEMTAHGPGEAVESALVVGADQEDRVIGVFRMGEPPSTGMPLWYAGNGTPVLTVDTLGAGRHLRYAGRFDPAWTDLVLKPAFPGFLDELIHGRPAPPNGRISRAQALPGHSEPLPAQRAGLSLVLPLWVLAAALLAADRLIAANRGRS